ncbi:MAG: hypothetical protein ABIH23_13555 [bacterium]
MTGFSFNETGASILLALADRNRLVPSDKSLGYSRTPFRQNDNSPDIHVWVWVVFTNEVRYKSIVMNMGEET